MIAALLGVSTLGFQSENIRDHTQNKLEDATFVARKVRGDQRELVKITNDFGASYRFDQIRFQYKEPLKLRLEATVDETSALYIINGPIQVIRVPRMRVSTRQNLTNAPGRRQSSLDFGVLTPSLFRELFEGKFVRRDRATGDLVFDLTYQQRAEDSSRHRIWVDPERGITTRREWYNQYGRQLATFFYAKPTREDGVWFPTELTVRNADNKVAGITRYETFRINTGLSDSLFSVN